MTNRELMTSRVGKAKRAHAIGRGHGACGAFAHPTEG
jgi:hypothetical protein